MTDRSIDIQSVSLHPDRSEVHSAGRRLDVRITDGSAATSTKDQKCEVRSKDRGGHKQRRKYTESEECSISVESNVLAD